LRRALPPVAAATVDSRPRELGLAFTAVNKDGSFVVMIGADGTTAYPDGVGVEVSGKAAATVVLILGRPKGDGKPGVARGESAFVVGAN